MDIHVSPIRQALGSRRSSLLVGGWVLANAVLFSSIWSHLKDPTLPWLNIIEQQKGEAVIMSWLVGLLLLSWIVAIFFILASTRGEESPLDGYVLGKKLGDGAFGSVYRATKTTTDEFGTNSRTFALKMISLTNMCDANDGIAEAMKMACVDHRSVVKVHEQFIDKAAVFGVSRMLFHVSPYRLCIALELCSGDLAEEICRWAAVAEDSGFSKHARPPWPQLLRIFREIVEGIEALHSMDIVHCDLKPANIFISADHKHVKIGDLGLAKTVSKSGARSKGLGFAGTPGYIAPEVWEDDAHSVGYSTSADNWSLGCVLVDIAYPTKMGGESVALILEEGGFPMDEERHEGDLALLLADPNGYPKADVLGCIAGHVSLSENPVARKIVENCLVEDPKVRWCCDETLKALSVLQRAPSILFAHMGSRASFGSESSASLDQIREELQPGTPPAAADSE